MHVGPRTRTIALCVLGAACQATPQTAAPRVESAPRLRIVALSAASVPLGEDGAGHLIAARAPVALEAVSPLPWPARALDPALTLGAARFYRYTYVSDGVLRFVAADRASLPSGPAWVQYGDDPSARTPLVAP